MADWYISSAAWTAIAQFATGSYSVGQIVRPLTAPAFGNQYAYRCTTAGTSGAEPSWPLTNNSTITTGGATFTCVAGQSAYGWTAAAGNLYALTQNTNRFAIGDRAFLSSDHSETSANGNYLIAPGQGYGLIQIISVNRAGSVPPVAADALAGATIVYNGASSVNFDAYCNFYWQGVTFNLGGTGSQILFANLGSKSHYLRNCALVISTSTTTGNVSVANPCLVTLDNTTVQFTNAAQRFQGAGNFELRWINTTSAVLGTVPTILFAPANFPWPTTVRGVDLSAVTTALFGNAYAVKGLLDSCRIASGVTRYSGTPSGPDDEVELVNCYDGTNIISERHTPAGDLTTSRTTTMVGGAQDDVGLFSHQMVSSTRADMLAMTLDSFWMDVENTLIGASHTATVEIASAITLNNTDISLQLEYLGTSGSSRASFTSTLPSALTASAAVATSSATWTGPVDTYTVLLCHCDGTNGSTVFTDSSSFAHTLTAAGTAQVNTTTTQFGTGSANFTLGSSPRITSSTPADFNLGAGQFTVEGWMYFTAGINTGNAVQVLVSQWSSTLGNLGWVLGFNSPSTMLFRYSTTGSDGINAATASFTPTLNTWYHLAADRDATNTVRLYINGAVAGSGTAAATIFASTLGFMIGNDNSNADYPAAYIDEVRITRGLARYAGAFTPPAAPFSISGATQHLQATFTPQQAGRLRGIVRLGKPSTTVYINPQITVT